MIQIITEHEDLDTLIRACVYEAFEKYPEVSGKLPKPKPEILNGDQLSEKLRISIPTLIRWRNAGKIPFIQIGSSIRYNLSDVVEALTVNKGKKKGGKL